MNDQARKILNLLADKHAGDVFVPECKDGPTQGASHFRMDAWAMKRSWTNPQVSGHEIKVTRSDYTADNKWPAYLPMCNCFYFVCPYGLIEKDEVPEPAGLLWATKKATRLYTKKKAAYREVEIPECVYRYILMSRAVIEARPYHHVDEPTDIDYWRRWLALKDEKKDVGWKVSKKLKQLVLERITKVEIEIQPLQRENETLTVYKELLDELGISTYGLIRTRDTAKRNLEDALRGVPKHLFVKMDRVIDELNSLKQLLEKLGKIDGEEK